MNIKIQRIYNQSGIETGAILSGVVAVATTIQQKNSIENSLVQYAFDKLYPGQGLSIYREVYIDTPAIVVVKEVNNLPQESVVI
ncbi:hypothetical protein ACFQZI_13240 [Mucilaginibacter lutimaris]|uniref:Uncharacterized protein n=1 Tax=Mucilaginibacter lutimaris TaxID=931629 RepID=A0ABW2ZI05_9SPHI